MILTIGDKWVYGTGNGRGNLKFPSSLCTSHRRSIGLCGRSPQRPAEFVTETKKVMAAPIEGAFLAQAMRERANHGFFGHRKRCSQAGRITDGARACRAFIHEARVYLRPWDKSADHRQACASCTRIKSLPVNGKPARSSAISRGVRFALTTPAQFLRSGDELAHTLAGEFQPCSAGTRHLTKFS